MQIESTSWEIEKTAGFKINKLTSTEMTSISTEMKVRV